jgi:hypothetical protein
MSKRQWEGWKTWMKEYLRNSEKVRVGVRFCIDQYDPDFVQFAKRILTEVEYEKKT